VILVQDTLPWNGPKISSPSLETVKNVPWVGISPGNVFQEGPAKPAILGKDHLLFNEQKQSVTSSGTLAKAIIDEIETVQHENTRFTVIDA